MEYILRQRKYLRVGFCVHSVAARRDVSHYPSEVVSLSRRRPITELRAPKEPEALTRGGRGNVLNGKP
jgi:hypothetical protein